MVESSKVGRGERSTVLIKKATVDSEPLPPKGLRKTIWDSELNGFGVRIASTGVKTYLLRYRMGGRDTPIRTVTIGQHGSPWTADQARRRAAELLTEVRAGRDIVAERAVERADAANSEEACEERQFTVKIEEWFTGHVEREGLRSRKDIRGVVDRDLKPAFAGKMIDEITRKDVTTALTAIGNRSGSAANKAHKWMRQLFNWLIEQGDIEYSPAAKVKKPFPENSRERVLSLGELVVVWVALDRLDEPFPSFYRLAILLGQRLREGSNVPWSEFDLEAGDWLLPSKRTKAKRDHIVPMPEQAIELLEDIQPDPKKRNGPVFTTNGRVGISGFSKLKTELDEAIAGLLADSEAARELVGESSPTGSCTTSADPWPPVVRAWGST